MRCPFQWLILRQFIWKIDFCQSCHLIFVNCTSQPGGNSLCSLLPRCSISRYMWIWFAPFAIAHRSHHYFIDTWQIRIAPRIIREVFGTLLSQRSRSGVSAVTNMHTIIKCGFDVNLIAATITNNDNGKMPIMYFITHSLVAAFAKVFANEYKQLPTQYNV